MRIVCAVSATRPSARARSRAAAGTAGQDKELSTSSARKQPLFQRGAARTLGSIDIAVHLVDDLPLRVQLPVHVGCVALQAADRNADVIEDPILRTDRREAWEQGRG